MRAQLFLEANPSVQNASDGEEEAMGAILQPSDDRDTLGHHQLIKLYPFTGAEQCVSAQCYPDLNADTYVTVPCTTFMTKSSTPYDGDARGFIFGV